MRRIEPWRRRAHPSMTTGMRLAPKLPACFAQRPATSAAHFAQRPCSRRGCSRPYRTTERLESRVELVQGLLLDRVDAEAGRAAVRGQHHGVALALAHEAEPALPVRQRAVARAEVALHAAVLAKVEPASGVVRLGESETSGRLLPAPATLYRVIPPEPRTPLPRPRSATGSPAPSRTPRPRSWRPPRRCATALGP